MIKVEDLSFCYSQKGQQHWVLKDISFAVKTKESCAIIGPSGCGKSSLLFLLAGLLQPVQGKVQIAEKSRCGTILQNFGLFPWKTVYENVALGLVLQKVNKREAKPQVEQIIEEMGLSAFAQYYPGQLSGGMQQRVALARALVIRPDILLMDEPLSSLDALTRERLQNLILNVWQEKEVIPVVVTHSIEEAVFLGLQIIVLGSAPGRIIERVDNKEAGQVGYRQSSLFFQRCNMLRSALTEECNVC